MRISTLVGSVLVALCACQPASPPEHPSATQEDALAKQDNAAGQHDQTGGAVPSCAGGVRGGVCWTPNEGPGLVAQHHFADAMEHRTNAAKLREARTRACDGVAEGDRNMSPFAHVKDIKSVTILNEGQRPAGAKVTFRKVEGMSAESLQRIVNCHVAEADALGHADRMESFCPLNPPNVKAVVTDAPDGYVVAISSDDPAAAAEVVKRAKALHQ